MSKSTTYRIHMQPGTDTERGYFEGDTKCECGLATENTAHMMHCILLIGCPQQFQRYSKEMRGGGMEDTRLMT